MERGRKGVERWFCMKGGVERNEWRDAEVEDKKDDELRKERLEKERMKDRMKGKTDYMKEGTEEGRVERQRNEGKEEKVAMDDEGY